MKNSVILHLFLLCMGFTAYGQESYDFSKRLQWSPEPVTIAMTENATEAMLQFEGAVMDPKTLLPHYQHRFTVNGYGVVNIQITGVQTEPLSQYQNVDLSAVTSNWQASVSIGIERKQPYAHVDIMPIRKNPATGIYEKAVEITYTITFHRTAARLSKAQRSSNSYAKQSVLATGQWFKVNTQADGVYRMDYQFLKDLGLPVDNMDPRNLQVYGNGGGMLPELNSAPRHDDLVENAIRVVGESDGRFDQGDYVLFFGMSAHTLQIDTVNVNGNPVPRVLRPRHLYADHASYFIRVGSQPGKRIDNAAPAGAATQSTSTYTYVQHYEVDKVNPAESGREWFGEKFDFAQTQRTFDFAVPGIVSSTPAYLHSGMIGRSLAGNVSFTARINGNTLFNRSFSTVGARYYDPFAKRDYRTAQLNNLPGNFQVQLAFAPSGADPESAGWLDYLTINARRNLQLTGDQMYFFDLQSVAPGAVTTFILSSGNLEVWDVTDPTTVSRIPVNNNAITVATDRLRYFMAFNGNSYLTPTPAGQVPNQDIHGTIGQPDVVIVTHPDFRSAADRLADFHRQHDGYQVAVVNVQQIYNEFSSGVKDAAAIRDLMRMLYERANTAADMPEHLILFGDGSYDYKNLQVPEGKNHNFIPTYQSYESMDRVITFASDDFYGLLDPHEGTDLLYGVQSLDIGVGRLVASTMAQANAIVDKIIHYHNPVSMGSWRNTLTFVADDEDGNTHIKDADQLANLVASEYPVYNIDKIYFDAYEQVSTPGGARYPRVNSAINSRIFSGTLLMNYTGHGGESGWAQEKVLGFDEMTAWKNYDRLPLFVTATCSFGRYDNPQRESGGEYLLYKADGGAVALVTAVRLVYSNANLQLNAALFDTLFSKVNGRYQTLGEVMRHAKNNVFGNANNRKFALLGDPAMTLGYPEGGVQSTRFQKEPFVAGKDTLKALEKVTIGGVVLNTQGQIMNNFNGVVYPTIYDKAETIRTLENDPQSNKRNFTLMRNVIYRGKASVNSGIFTYTFIVPKDINYSYGMGKISYYAEDGTFDAHGFDDVVVGGSADSISLDNEGPKVKVYMNNEDFVFGGTTNENPILLVKLSDDSGINTAGSAIGHDISGILDEETTNKIALNEFYEAALDDFTRGEVRYPLSELEVGRHVIRVKAWDVHNNSGEGYTEFIVAESAELALRHVLNYPNPFTTNTAFWFEHNRPGVPLEVTVQIFTVSGKVVKTIRQQVVTEGFRVDDIRWDGRDDYGSEIGKGVYVYKLSVATPEGDKASTFEKLVLLR